LYYTHIGQQVPGAAVMFNAANSVENFRAGAQKRRASAAQATSVAASPRERASQTEPGACPGALTYGALDPVSGSPSPAGAAWPWAGRSQRRSRLSPTTSAVATASTSVLGRSGTPNRSIVMFTM
jgi:hypothetical protein